MTNAVLIPTDEMSCRSQPGGGLRTVVAQPKGATHPALVVARGEDCVTMTTMNTLDVLVAQSSPGTTTQPSAQ